MAHNQTRAEEIQNYDVVGATLVPEDDELPMRLRPVMRTRTEPHAYVLLYDEDDGEILVPETPDFIEEMFAERRFYRLHVPLQAQPGHWLVQVEPGRLPDYRPAEELRRLVREQGERALREGARAASAGRLAEALERVAYAVRALYEDPFPILALIALGRDEFSESQVEVHTWLLRDFTPEHIQRRFQEARDDANLDPVVERIRKDPLCDEYDLMPAWLLRRRSGLPREWWSELRAA